MSLKVSTKQAEFEPIPENTYGAICYSVVDIGQQYNEKFKKTSAKIILIWEIVDDDLREDFGRGKSERRAISKQYTASFNEKSNLYKDIRPWLGRELGDDTFDLASLAGQPCMLTVINSKGSDGKIYANVASVSKVMKGAQLGEPENAIVIYDIDESGEEVFNALPEWIQKKIQESKSPNAQSANSVNVVVDADTGEVIETKVEKPAEVAPPPVAKPKPEPKEKAEETPIDGIAEEGTEDYPF
jgi:hypothetical protein